jgi:hypothetical protein
MENRYRTVPDARLDARAVDQKMQIGIVGQRQPPGAGRHDAGRAISPDKAPMIVP